MPVFFRAVYAICICMYLGYILGQLVDAAFGSAFAPTPTFYVVHLLGLAAGVGALLLLLGHSPSLRAQVRVLITAALVLMAINFGLVGGLILHWAHKTDTRSILPTLVSSTTFQGALALVTVWFFRQHGRSVADALGLRNSNARRVVAHAAGLAAAAFACQWVYVNLLAQLRFDLPEQPVVELIRAQDDYGWRVFLALFTILLAPVAEEMFFRGVLYTTMRQHLGTMPAALASATVFAMIHFNLGSFLPLLVLAVGLALIYERTGNILAPMLAHSLFNTTNYVLLYLVGAGLHS